MDEKELVKLVNTPRLIDVDKNDMMHKLTHIKIKFKTDCFEVIKESASEPPRLLLIHSLILNTCFKNNKLLAAYTLGNKLFTRFNDSEQPFTGLNIDILYQKNKIAVRVNGLELGQLIFTDDTIDIDDWFQFYLSTEAGDIYISYLPFMKNARKFVFWEGDRDEKVKAVIRQSAQLFLMPKGGATDGQTRRERQAQ